MERLTFNIGGAAIRREDLKGRRHMVVPMVMLVEGVVPGSNGPLLYPGEEVERWAPAWNYRPIVSYHPEQNGKGVSACDPIILDTQEVGVTMNIVCDEQPNTGLKRWRGQAWLDEERLQKIDKDTYDALMRNEKVEVSTGLYTENEQTSGEFKGTAYDAIARNYKPDHLAILFGKTGACTVAQGAGLLQLNRAGGINVEETSKRIQEAITNALEEASRDYWELSLNEWSDAAREAAIKARQAHAKGPAKPNNIRVSKRLGRSWLHSKGHDVGKMSDSEVHAKLKEYARDKKHHGALRELARDTEGEKRGMPPRAHHAPERKAEAKTESSEDKRSRWQKDFDAGQEASRKVMEERKGKVQPSRPKTAEEEKAGLRTVKSPSAKDDAPPKEEAKASPAAPKEKKKGGRKKYQDSGKREPLIPKSWKGKYAVKAKKKPVRNAWSDAAREAAATARRWKATSGKDLSKRQKRYLAKSLRQKGTKPWNGADDSFLDSDAPAYTGFKYANVIAPYNRMIAGSHGYKPDPEDMLRLKRKRDEAKVRLMKRQGIANAWSPQARQAAALARKRGAKSNSDVYAGALMEEYVGHRKEGKDHDRAMRRVKQTHAVTMGTSGGGSGSFQKGYGAFKQQLASSKIYGAEVSASARAKAKQVAADFLGRPTKHVIA